MPRFIYWIYIYIHLHLYLCNVVTLLFCIIINYSFMVVHSWLTITTTNTDTINITNRTTASSLGEEWTLSSFLYDSSSNILFMRELFVNKTLSQKYKYHELAKIVAFYSLVCEDQYCPVLYCQSLFYSAINFSEQIFDWDTSTLSTIYYEDWRTTKLAWTWDMNSILINIIPIHLYVDWF